jgi:hypothetical protein
MIGSLAAGSIFLPGAVHHLLSQEQAGASKESTASRLATSAGWAKHVIFLYLAGGVSHLDSFDPKPRLFADSGKPIDSRNPNSRRFLKPMCDFKPGGQCGTEVSDLFPHLRDCMDDICVVRSMQGDHIDHFEATLDLHAGSTSAAAPSLGSLVSHGFQTSGHDLPAFVVLAPRLPYGGARLWSAGSLPPSFAGTRVTGNSSKSISAARDLHATLAPALDATGETEATRTLYGLGRDDSMDFAQQCLVARRLIERGVRFVELIDTGSHDNWDAHYDLNTLRPRARSVDQPVAGLLKDLKSRGLLDETLVVCATEFGRTPFCDGPGGRGHQSRAFSSWLAGGGVRGGMIHGQTDDYGSSVIENRVHLHDLHATILHCLGLDPRLTGKAGKVVPEILA